MSKSPILDIVNRIIETRREERTISPTWVANEVLDELDPPHYVDRHYPLIYLGCHSELRQLARKALAKSFNPESKESECDDLFPNLQWRYPEAHSDELPEPTYVLREMMSKEDVEYNVARLRAEADAKNKHADALEAWHATRR